MTSSLKYASLYASTKATAITAGGPPKKPAVLVCAVIPGNILPVVDVKTYYGKHVADGYQSHFTIGIFFFLVFICFLALFRIGVIMKREIKFSHL